VFPLVRGLPCNPRTNIEQIPLRGVMYWEEIYPTSTSHVGGVRDKTFTFTPVTEGAGTLREGMAAMDRKTPVSRGNTSQLSFFQYCREAAPHLTRKYS